MLCSVVQGGFRVKLGWTPLIVDVINYMFCHHLIAWHDECIPVSRKTVIECTRAVMQGELYASKKIVRLYHIFFYERVQALVSLRGRESSTTGTNY